MGASLQLIVALGATITLNAAIGAVGYTAARRWLVDTVAVGISGAVLGLAALAGLGIAAPLIDRRAYPGAIALVVGIVAAAGAVLATRALATGGLRRSSMREPLVVTLLTGGVALVYSSITFMHTAPAEIIDFIRHRFAPLELPGDNELPGLFARDVIEGRSTRLFFGDWNGSDRPPLTSGWILADRSVTDRIPGMSMIYTEHAAAVVAQLMWIAASYALVRALGIRSREAALMTVAVAGTGTMLLNTVFTWPKLLATALVLVALSLLITARTHGRRPITLVVCAGLAIGLACLTHGATAFTIPLVAIIGLWAMAPFGARTTINAGLVAIAAVAGTYAPWLYYQHTAGGPGDRLLKWHLAGYIPPTESSFGEVIRSSYAALSPGDFIHNRLANLGITFNLSPLWHTAGGTNMAENRANAEFLLPVAALGFFIVPILWLVASLLRIARSRHLSLRVDAAAWLLRGTLASVLVWCALMFGPGTTKVHQGSHVWLLLPMAVSFAWLARRHLWAALAVVAASWVETALVYVTNAGTPRASAVGTIALGVACVAAALWWVWKTPNGRHEPGPTPRRPAMT